MELFHPAVAGWFRGAFPGGPTEAQRLAWPRIAAGESVLLVSPTGTGKTLAAFLVALDALLRGKAAGRDERRLSVVYVSPLKALDNDIHRNLETPRQEILRAAGIPGLRIETAVRTGDTSRAARAAQVKRPPDVLITTPESLYLMLTGASRRLFADVTTLILDEVHAVAGTKRGAHLALSLERLESVLLAAGRPSPQRIALSATVEPVERVAGFVGGAGRDVTPLVVNAPKRLELEVVAPAELGKDEGSAWKPAVDAIAAVVLLRRTTLVFCNNRRHAERVAALLSERLGHEVLAHHGSIAKALREKIERDLKAGALRVLVATGSLELGLDVGPIEAVVQLTSPKGIARALQRVGRSGHMVGEVSRGRLVPLYVDDLFECAATAEGMKARDVEETLPPEHPLDVLAQQIVAECVARASVHEPVTADELFETFVRAAPYARLSRSLFHETLAMLSGKYPKERFAELAPKLVWDRATGRVAPLPAARLAALLDGGTIPDRGAFKAVLPDGKTVVGELDEEFVYETRVGDVFLLGSRGWRAVEITHDRVLVEDATGLPARMPFWKGEGFGRSPKVGVRVGRLKRLIAGRLDDPALPDVLREQYACDETAGAALIGAVRREAMEPAGVASDTRVVFETFPNDLGDPCVVVRSVFGRGVNLPWSLALSSVLREETGVDVESVASDDGILLKIPRAEREIPLGRLARLGAREAKERLLAALPNSPMFGARFRENAQRALLLPRARSGRRTPFWLQRLKARDLLQTTRSLPDFPIVAETYRDCLKDLWEYDRLLRLLDDLESGAVERTLDARRSPSPASSRLLFNFVAAYIYEWDAPKAEKGMHALALNRELLGEVLGEGADDGIRPEAAAEAGAAASRLVPHRMARSADELLLFFQELGDLTGPEVAERCVGDGTGWLTALRERGSVVVGSRGGETRFVAAEEKELYAALHGPPPESGARDRILLRFFATRGPAPAADAARRHGLGVALVEETLERLRLDGLVVAGRFGAPDGPRRWAGARLTEAIRRRTLTILRREIRPVPVAVFRGLLARRQGVEPGSRFSGEGAAERAVALLRGLPLPVLSWESALLPARLATPEPDALDVLSARGLLVWRASGEKDPRAARLAFLFRGEGALVLPEAPSSLDPLSPLARTVHEDLALHGASFAADLVSRLGESPRAMDRALLELLLAGLGTGDGLHGLRELLIAGRLGASRPADDTQPLTSFGLRPGRSTLRAARSRVATRLRLQGSRPLRRGGAVDSGRSGRWSLLAATGVLGEPVRADERADAWARLLLARWGVVSRDVLAREDPSTVRWGDVAPAFARMELRGDARRGEFVEGCGPLQYAEPETVEALRAAREASSGGAPDRDGDPVLTAVCGADPVLFGLDPGPTRDELVVLSEGAPLLRLAPDGTLALATPPPPDRTLRASLTALQDLRRRGRDALLRPRRLVVTSIDGRSAPSSPVAPLLHDLGFMRDEGRFLWRAP